MSNIDLRLLERQMENLRAKDNTGGNDGSDGGPPMEGRIINLERDMTDVKVSLGKIETRISHIELSMLTKGQAAIFALVAGIAIFGAGWWVVQQYLAPLVAALPAQ